MGDREKLKDILLLAVAKIVKEELGDQKIDEVQKLNAELDFTINVSVDDPDSFDIVIACCGHGCHACSEKNVKLFD